MFGLTRGSSRSCPPGYRRIRSTRQKSYAGKKLNKPIKRDAFCRRMPGMAGLSKLHSSPFFDDLGDSPFYGVGSDFGQLTLTESVTKVASMDNLKGIGAATAGLLSSTVIQGLLGKFNLPANFAMYLAPLGGAAVGSIIGNVLLKSEKAGDMAIGASLAGMLAKLAANPLKDALKMSGLGYMNDLGQVYLPEDVQVSGGNVGQLYLPENVDVNGADYNEFVSEEELMGEAVGDGPW